jgi:predicted enzyme related to lactoylglutathione lyase
MSGLHLHSVVVDVPRADHERAVAFWSAAVGVEPVVSEKYPEYAQFAHITPEVHLLVQATGDTSSRVHLDFGTPDRDGEVARLEELGGEVLDRTNAWVVMRDPAGVVFCICPVDGCEVSDV